MRGWRNLADVLEVYRAAHDPVLIWGPPGVGKTAAVEALGASRVATVILSQREPGDLAPMVILNDADAGQVVSRIVDRDIDAVMDDPSAILFLDELSCADSARQAAALEILGSRRIAGRAIRAWIVAAANPSEYAASGGLLSAPAANRVAHEEYEGPETEEYASFLATKYPENPTALAIGAFLEDEPSLLISIPRDEEAQSRAWPSPRSWEAGIRAVNASGDRGAAFAVKRLRACVGEAGQAAYDYLATVNIPRGDALLAMPSLDATWRPDVQRIAGRVAVAYARRAGKLADAVTLLIRTADEQRPDGSSMLGVAKSSLRLIAPAELVVFAHKLPKDVLTALASGDLAACNRERAR